jgi:hypothetical protein
VSRRSLIILSEWKQKFILFENLLNQKLNLYDFKSSNFQFSLYNFQFIASIYSEFIIFGLIYEIQWYLSVTTFSGDILSGRYNRFHFISAVFEGNRKLFGPVFKLIIDRIIYFPFPLEMETTKWQTFVGVMRAYLKELPQVSLTKEDTIRLAELEKYFFIH